MKTVIAIILFIGAVGVFFGYTNPKYQEVKATKTDIESYKEDLQLSKEILAKRDDLQQKYNNFLPADLAALDSLLPDYVDNVKLILDMNTVAKRYALSLKGISINEAKEVAGDGTGIASPTNSVDSILVSFRVTAPYDSFVKFLRDLERSLRVVDVTALNFKSVDNGVYDYAVTVKTYWLAK